MLMSHLGRPEEGVYDEEFSLAPVAQRLVRAARAARCASRRTGSTASRSSPGEVVLLENVRFNKGEKKDNEDLSKKMAALCDVYVKDAFGTAHRAEATTHGVARFAKVACAGPLLMDELIALETRAREAEAAAGRDRRRLEGLHQADDPGEPAERSTG